jgi:hypothetical protein
MRGMVLAAVLAVALVGLLTLGGCVVPNDARNQDTGWKAPRSGMTQADLDRATAACDYDVARSVGAPVGVVAVPSGRFGTGVAVAGANMMAAGSTAGLWEMCMKASGWQRAY